ncbi:hypothetical protein [Streptomyces nigrescens]|uniref:Uncharacterized protein n=1 Tax=Streptomyces nigrescens TaxID=1920 RepID=A0A640T9Q3_STRNI|nr:hypothetical protein [Streptomyces libani]WAT94909.1 hypothetical protein STRLI_000581 [Streptomyces libani subsp. libani]GFE20058.1 hypothetical protein Sliba_05110 [Streptomyces libani subsp. libani]GGV85704.1 hypothetical protein GCM10010500_02640 [Streptomyces libani subsp. libani]
MFKKHAEKREASRRHRQIMNAAYHLLTPGLHLDTTARLSPEDVVVLAYGRHQIRITEEEARDALGAALLERGFDLGRMTTT